MREHESEPVRGLPERPPAGEQVLWQGAPDWRTLARRSFHGNKIALYLGVLLLWSALQVWPLTQDSALGFGRSLGMATVAIGLVAIFAWLTARSTVYTITDKRLVIRFGVALPMTINVPFAMVDDASVQLNADGSGDLSLALRPGQKIAYLVLWPHTRPWRLARAQPSLRGIADAGRVAQILARALAASAEQAAGAVPQPRARTAGGPVAVAA